MLGETGRTLTIAVSTVRVSLVRDHPQDIYGSYLVQAWFGLDTEEQGGLGQSLLRPFMTRGVWQ
jgi:hypothetical protein